MCENSENRLLPLDVFGTLKMTTGIVTFQAMVKMRNYLDY